MQKPTIKIVQKFFTKAQAKNAISYQKQKAKKENIFITKVESVNAYDLFKSNGWLKKSPFINLANPTPDDYVIIVQYNYNIISTKKTSSIKRKIANASKLKNAPSKFHIVKLTKTQKHHILITTLSYVSNVSVPAWRFKFETQTSFGSIKSKSIDLTTQYYRYSIAA